MFADFNAGNIRANRLKLTADFRRCIRLEIKCVLVRRSTRQIDHDDRLVCLPNTGGCFRLEKLRQGQPTQTQRTDLQEIPAGNAVAELRTGTLDRQHDLKSVRELADDCYRRDTAGGRTSRST